MNFLYWAETSFIGEWVSTSLWGYPIALTLHTVGMGTLVGLALMICLRVLGFGQEIPPHRLKVFWILALVGFVINLLSGTALFFGSATVLWESWPFRIKIVFIAMGLIGTHCLVKSLIRIKVISVDSIPEGIMSLGRMSVGQCLGKQRILAFVMVLIWVAALVAGRLIAYIF